jgi:cytochrome c biogenesis protein
MASSETEVQVEGQPSAAASAVKTAAKKESILDRILALLSSVRFGVTMLCIVLICAMIGMLIMQQSVDGFQEYYRKLTPAQRLIYGNLLFFDIYHAWYFSLLLAITGLNIILASIDRFPTAWQYVAKPRLKASPGFIRAQSFNAEARMGEAPNALKDKVTTAWKKIGFKPHVTEENGRVTVFGQRNVWNRLGAYSVHVALLTIFTGGVLTARLGVGGMMEIRPGSTSNKIITSDITLEGPIQGMAELPFSIECTDLQQKLIRPEGGLESTNTIDWLSYVKIKDGPTDLPALIHLNYPYDYRGYRFFQNAFVAMGNARQITVSFEPIQGGEAVPVTIRRNESADVPGIGRVAYKGFFPDFDISARDTVSGDYNNPVAQLEITGLDGARRGALALNPAFADQLLAAQSKDANADAALREALLVNGNKVLLRTFEKAALTHTLAVQYDPGRIPFYIGSLLLIMSLCGVFFFSHQRVWAVIEPEGSGSKVFLGGNVNRNRNAFEGRFNLLVQTVTGERRQINE